MRWFLGDHRVDLGDAERLELVEGREKGGQPAGEHGLPGGGGSDEEEVVAPRSGDFEGPFRDLLAAHIAQVRNWAGVGGRRAWSREKARASGAREVLDRLPQGPDRDDLNRLDQCRLE